MKQGDLVVVPDCDTNPEWEDLTGSICGCWFCNNGSNRIGFVLGPAGDDLWEVAFDQGIYELSEGEASVLNESR